MRLAVQIDLFEPLVSDFILDGNVQIVEYENLPNICFSCGKYGHKKDECPDGVELGNSSAKISHSSTVGQLYKEPTNMEKGDVGEKRQIDGSNKQIGVGPWMIVSFRRKQ